MHVVSDNERRLISIPNACRRLGRSYAAVYNAVLSGKLPAERVDGRWFIDLAEVEVLENRRAEAAPGNG